ncbi:hypothetical protein J5X91_17735 [Pseudoalteromonas sp. K222D]|uniref:hypothetical protein n=1 Tax=Pseudoalteromonas sp. K222D TaxID=2820756 RepID=UPI001AD749F8|nr:hypothetical protein [Pseudoalteromonas sp. K222D]MBO7928078.1 hypothetical protein [Pseudoalteromonas sp. K222D]
MRDERTIKLLAASRKINTMRKLIMIFALIGALVASWNYLTLQKKLSGVLASDPRNEGISVFVHFEWFVNPSIIVFDIRDVQSDKSPLDVSIVLLQLSESLKDNEYHRVVLSFKGRQKFMLEGSYFKETGMEYGIQNPVYTLRSLSQNVYKLDGSQAFSTWTGGFIGVLGKQMEDLTEFHKQWYINELATGS